MRPTTVALIGCLVVTACGRLDHVNRAPEFDPVEGSLQHHAMHTLPLPDRVEHQRAADEASIWATGSRALLGDRRAARRGDILTVVIAIDERAEMSNASATGRSGTAEMGVGALFGLPERIDRGVRGGLSLDPAVSTTGASSFRGDGSTRRSERLTLRVAATVVETLPNGVLRIEGTQEVRVNNELRELIVTGYVRPDDISRRNEVTYDKIAGARIAYGGRGIISDVQRPRWGQAAADNLLPF